MRRLIAGFTIIILGCLLFGCKTTGYTIWIKTDQVKYADLIQLESFLTNRGFQIGTYQNDTGDMVEWKERKLSGGEVYTSFERKFSDEPYHWVDVYLYYFRDNNDVRRLRVSVGNIYKGLIVPDLKSEIDNTGDLLYEDIASKVGKEKVTIERKEWGPPVIY